MIAGIVDEAMRAIVPVTAQGEPGQTFEIETVLDTGFNGFLMLPRATFVTLGLAPSAKSRFSKPKAMRCWAWRCWPIIVSRWKCATAAWFLSKR